MMLDPFSLAEPPALDQPSRYRWATVTQTDPLTIRLDGDTDPLPFTPDTLVDPLTLSAGRRVWVQFFGRRLVVLGASPAPEAPWVCTLYAATGNAQTMADNVAAVLSVPDVFEDPRGMADAANNRIILGKSGWWVVNMEATFGNNGAGFVQGTIFVNPTGGMPTTSNVSPVWQAAFDYRDASTWRTTVAPRSQPTYLPKGTSVWGTLAQNTAGAIPLMDYQDTPRLSAWLYHD